MKGQDKEPRSADLPPWSTNSRRPNHNVTPPPKNGGGVSFSANGQVLEKEQIKSMMRAKVLARTAMYAVAP